MRNHHVNTKIDTFASRHQLVCCGLPTFGAAAEGSPLDVRSGCHSHVISTVFDNSRSNHGNVAGIFE